MSARPRPRVAASALALLLALASAAPALAQDRPIEPDPPRGSVRLVVTSLTAVVGPGAPRALPEEPPPSDFSARILVENDGGAALDNLRLVVEPFGSVDTRSELRVALDGGEIAAARLRPTDVAIRDGAALQPGEIAGVTAEVTAAQGGWDDGESHVHPVQLTVVRGTEVLDQVRTAVVYLADPPASVLETALVWPLHDRPWRGPDGVYEPGVDAAIRPDGRLDRILGAAERLGPGGLLLAPSTSLLEDLRDRADGFLERRDDGDGGTRVVNVPTGDPAALLADRFLERLRAVVATGPEPVAGPYADADLAALVGRAAPLPELAATAAVQGQRRLPGLLERQPDRSVYLSTTPLTPAVLDVVPGDHLLLPWDQVVGPDLDAFPSSDVPFPLRSVRAPSGRQLSATVADPWVSQLIEDPDLRHGPVVAAHRVAVETAALFLRAPSGPGRPLLALPPVDWSPGPRFADLVARQLSAAPWLQLTEPSAHLTRTGGSPGELRLAQTDEELHPDVGRELPVALRQLDAAVAALPEDVDTVGGRLPGQLADQLLRVPSIWYRGRDRSLALVRDAQSAIDATFGDVEVPRTAQITLTSDRGTIPVTLQRTSGGPIRVRVDVASQGRLTWPDGESTLVTLTPDSAQTVSFATRALGRGTFLVAVTVRDPEGERIIERTSLSVRSTTISRPALIVTGVIVVLLLLRGVARRRSDDDDRHLEVVRS